MTRILRPDLCVIGGGPGGLAAARAAAGLGAKVVLVEKRIPANGEHMRFAWLSQILAATAASRVQTGMGETRLPPDFKMMRRACDAAMGRFAREDSPARLAGLNVQLIPQAGSFTRRARFETADSVIEARHFVVAIASLPAAPAIPGIDLVRPLTPDRIAELNAVPERLAVLGANADNLQLIQSLQRLGSKVVLFQTGAFLADEDPELATPLLDSLRREGLEIVSHSEVSRIEPAAKTGVKLILADGSGVEASHLLYAARRNPLTEGLGLKAAGVAYDREGITRNAAFRTTNPKIFALNDGLDSFHRMTEARCEGEWLAAHLCSRNPPKPLHNARIIAADPEIATIGLSEAEARAQGAIRVLRAGFCDSLRAQALQPMRHPVTGHIKIVTDGQDRILGAGIVGPQAREVIGVFCLALANRLKAKDLGVLAGSEPALIDVCRVAALASPPQTGKVSSRRIFAALGASLRAFGYAPR